MDEDLKYKSTLGFPTLPVRTTGFKSADRWLEDKREIDGAEGLWRVYDDLYDLSDFVDKHPGGKFWLVETKGLDITEAFESHHISMVPEEMLKKYYVRKAKSPRTSPFTFEENGFYKTLKRNVREVLTTLPKNARKKTEMLTDSLLIGAYSFAILACIFSSYIFACIAGILITCTSLAAHNYYHQKDSYRIYYSDLCMSPSRENRIIHILSHHLFPNTTTDLQAFLAEPLLDFFPQSKSKWVRFASWVYVPLVIWPLLIYFVYFTKVYLWIFMGNQKSLNKTDFLALVLPTCMYIFGGQPLFTTISIWAFIILVHGFMVGALGTTTTHFHPDIFVDGDAPRLDMDWGINQLDTVSDRHEVTGNLFLVLVTFGDHALHHLFPTFDHGVLHYLYPVVEETMKKFNIGIRMTSHLDMFGGFFRQLARDKPNPEPPNLSKGVKF